mmetsp:Transcript_8019/g.11450  ORF Transcript_8019/g.11450 Transcript_8019/m.11450 type:complete len:131 (-) Transcript_8019:540-932(-)
MVGHAYLDPSLDESILHSIHPSITHTRERVISKISIENLTPVEESGLDVPERRTFVSTNRHVILTSDLLADRFEISPGIARKTLRATMQRGTQSALLPLSRQYNADRNYKLKRLDGDFLTDTFYEKKKSL